MERSKQHSKRPPVVGHSNPWTALGDHHKSEAWARIRSGGSAVLTYTHGRRRFSDDPLRPGAGGPVGSYFAPGAARPGEPSELPESKTLRRGEPLLSPWPEPPLLMDCASFSSRAESPPLRGMRPLLHVGRAPSIRGQSPLYTWAEPPLYVGRAPSIRGQSPLYTWAEPPLYVGRAPSIRGRSPLYTWAEPPLYVGVAPSLPQAEPRLCVGYAPSAGRAPSLRGRSPSSSWAEPALLVVGRAHFRRGVSPALRAPRRPHPSLLLDPGSAPSKVGVRARCCRSPWGRVAPKMRCAR